MQRATLFSLRKNTSMGKFKFGKNIYTKTVRVPQDWDVLEMHRQLKMQKFQKSTDGQLRPTFNEEDEYILSTLQAA